MDGVEVFKGKSLENLCRSCLKILNNEEAQNILTPELEHIILYFFPEASDKFPTKMCVHCYERMQESYSFYELCQESTRKCLEMLQENIIKLEHQIKQEEDTIIDDRSLNFSDYDNDDDDNESEADDYDPLNQDNEENLDEDDDPEDIKPLIQKKAPKPSKSSSEVYNCDKCDKRFFKEFRYRAHMRVHEGLKGYECPKCQKTFAKASTLSGHIRDIHEEPGATYTCNYPGCEKVYARQQTLKWHQKQVHEKPDTENKVQPLIICEECGKTFKNMNSLKKHR